MRVILKWCDDYFKGYGLYNEVRVTDDIQQAQVFKVTMSNGGLYAEPSLPIDDDKWELVPVFIKIQE